jgi:hypothetical protein
LDHPHKRHSQIRGLLKTINRGISRNAAKAHIKHNQNKSHGHKKGTRKILRLSDTGTYYVKQERILLRQLQGSKEKPISFIKENLAL